jgi:hypothetical protein
MFQIRPEHLSKICDETRVFQRLTTDIFTSKITTSTRFLTVKWGFKARHRGEILDNAVIRDFGSDFDFDFFIFVNQGFRFRGLPKSCVRQL